MEILFDNVPKVSPRLSIVLLDWSCRESFHVLDYLADQTVEREQYELIWIEYYDRRAEEIDKKIEQCALAGKPPPLDRWVRLRMPKDVYYHKHLMYNVGIVLSRGEIVVICDSDAILTRNFLATIIQTFEQSGQIVLHMDQVRNNDRRFYPFNYPSVEEVIGEGSINWANGKTTGLWDTLDILHTRNYGACMAAFRKDLIQIGGADEHIDFLGHVCGPYDMTFRLVNAGKTEVWHPAEFLYHVWHPGQAGEKNYVGPHDGRHMSSRALLGRLTGRTLPFKENTVIRRLRLEENPSGDVDSLEQLISQDNLLSWSTQNIAKLKPKIWRAFLPSRRLSAVMRLFKIFLRMSATQIRTKVAQLRSTEHPRGRSSVETELMNQSATASNKSASLVRIYRFSRRLLETHYYIVQCSKECLRFLAAEGQQGISIYGAGDVAEILYELSLDEPVQIKWVYDDVAGNDFHGLKVLRIEDCESVEDRFIITSLIGVDDRVKRLKALGVAPERIFVLQ